MQHCNLILIYLFIKLSDEKFALIGSTKINVCVSKKNFFCNYLNLPIIFLQKINYKFTNFITINYFCVTYRFGLKSPCESPS